MQEQDFCTTDGFLDWERVRVDPSVAMRFPSSLALRYHVLPLCAAQGELWVASAAQDRLPRSELLRIFGENTPIRVLPAEKETLKTQLRAVYGELSQSAVRLPGAAGTGVSTGESGDDAVLLAEELLRAAALRRASDIHIDPEKDGVRVRFRTDGVLELYRVFPSRFLAPLVSRLKVLAGLDIAERRAPQDGAFSWRKPPTRGMRFGSTGSGVYDVRAATLPVRNGERVTLRLLETDGASLSLEALGMNETQLQRFSRVLEHPHGLVLLTGPTGSGKTTSLYAAIQRLLERAPLNILTVEDPVEYEIAGVAQCEVDSSDKVSFGKALRSLLRHDPDVVMIGEIRDSESLDTAVKAALTGHLVLSTLHTNDSVSTVTRLTDMGLAPHLTAATLRLSVAQRLVQRLCPVCRRETVVSEVQAAWLGRASLAGKRAWEKAGCVACAGRGTVGRIGLFEFMEPDEETASAIASRVPETELRARLFRKGFQTLLDDALEKSDAGMIALRDILV